MSSGATSAKKVRVAISAGDPQGVGPEVTVRALLNVRSDDADFEAVVFGEKRRLEEMGLAKLAGIDVVDVAFLADDEPSSTPSSPPSRAGGRHAFEAFDAAIDAVRSGRSDALVTAPLSKEAVAMSQPGFRGHTEELGRRFGVDPVMMLTDGFPGRLRVALVTDHVPLSQVSKCVTEARVEHVLRTTVDAARDVFRCPHPRVAVLGLNPHAGEGGELGREESEVITPVIRRLVAEGLGVDGPFPADSFFAHRRDDFDAVCAMYHDQGLGPLKMEGFGRGINLSLGIPIWRTSPDHGTAYDAVGTAGVEPSSMEAALRAAFALARSRR